MLVNTGSYKQIGDDSLFINYITQITLHRNNRSYKSSLCVSQASLESLKREISNYLHPAEANYFKTLQYKQRQHSYLLGRYCAKHAIASYTQENYTKNIYIDCGVFQQPVVRHPKQQNLQISISHTDSIGVALAFPEDHPMGIDIEKIDKYRSKTVESQLTAHEKISFSNYFTNKTLRLITIWTIKEALSKVLKCGLMISFNLLEIDSMQLEKNYLISFFKEFKQYKAISFLVENKVISMITPKETAFNLDISLIQTTFESYKNQSWSNRESGIKQ